MIFYFYCKRVISTEIVHSKSLAWYSLIQVSYGLGKVAAAAKKAFKLDVINANKNVLTLVIYLRKCQSMFLYLVQTGAHIFDQLT